MMFQVIVLAFLPFICRADMMAGGLSDTDMPLDSKIVTFAMSAVNQYYAKEGDNAVRDAVDVVKAQSQVVAGISYHLTLRVKTGDQTSLCFVKIWDRPWLNDTQVTDGPDCKPEKTILGGQQPVDINAKDVQMALGQGVEAMNARSNSMFLHVARGVQSVTVQVVAGKMYHFKGVSLSSTGCMRDVKDLSNCMADGKTTQTCDFDVLFQSWMTPAYTLHNFNCQ